MNFFEAQDKARKNTFFLNILFLLGVVGIIIITNIFLLIALTYFQSSETALSESQNWQWQYLFEVSTVVIAVVAVGSIYKLFQLSSGGHVVAEALGGRLIPRNTINEQEQTLLNVIDEMAIASGINSPPVYLLEQEGINAFAAGLSHEDAVIGITKGALNAFERDELQGVIAHEFSHIFNGDMRLNQRITGLLHGILLIGLIGRAILDSLRHTRSSSKKDGGAIGAFMFLGLGLSIIGFVGTTMGELIKSMISRQREYLADASAVQFTRYPQGIADALKKIGGNHTGSKISNPAAATYSHFYFSNALSGFWDNLFATHPPLDERIKRIQPRWDGKYLDPHKPITSRPKHYQEPKTKKQKVFEAVTTATVLGQLDKIGQPSSAQIKQASSIINSFPISLVEMAKEPLSAQAVILALLSSKDEGVLKQQFSLLEDSPIGLLEKTKAALTLTNSLVRDQHLQLIQLSMPSLKMMSSSQYRRFKASVLHFIDADKKVTLFEWNMTYLVLHPLDLFFNIKKPAKEVYHSIKAIKPAVQGLISMLIRTQTPDNDKAQAIFEAAKANINAPSLVYVKFNAIDTKLLDDAIAMIEKASLSVRKQVLQMSLFCLSEDQRLSTLDLEILHAIAATLKLPLSLKEDAAIE